MKRLSYIEEARCLKVNIALEYVVRQLSVRTTSTLLHKSVQLIVYADYINITGRTKGAIADVYGKLKQRAKEVGLIINVDKTKAMVQKRRLREEGTLTVEDQRSEMVRSFKYLGTVINVINYETEEIRARILAANKAYSSLQTTFRSKQIHRNNKIRPYKTLINPYPTAFPYGNGMVLHFYQQQESSTTKTVHKVINKGLKTYV